MKILVTGAAGFIGYHVAQQLLIRGDDVVGLDNLNAYYDVGLKKARLDLLEEYEHFEFVLADLENREKIAQLFQEYRFDRVVHLGAQAGVRYSIDNPQVYIDSNVVGTANILEGCRHSDVQHLVYASSSSVYGLNTDMPFSTSDSVDHPISLYAAAKKSNELMAHTYSHLYQLPTTGLRFFTVYGPWGRPDMALFVFTKAILEGRPIKVFNQGKMRRDFTYIDDIVDGVLRVTDTVAEPNLDWNRNSKDVASSSAPYRLYNIGNNTSVGLLEFIDALESALGVKAVKEMLPIQPGDVPETYADINDLERAVGFKPTTDIYDGIERFVKWYQGYYQHGIWSDKELQRKEVDANL